MAEGEAEAGGGAVAGLVGQYRRLVLERPVLVGSAESLLATAAYLIPGVDRLHLPEDTAELMYAASRVLGQVHDGIIADSALPPDEPPGQPSFERVLFYLTAVEHVQLSTEMVGRRLGGARGQWAAVYSLEGIKMGLRAMLLFRFGSTLLASPPLAPVDRSLLICEDCQRTLVNGACPACDAEGVFECRCRRSSAHSDAADDAVASVYVGARTGRVLKASGRGKRQPQKCRVCRRRERLSGNMTAFRGSRPRPTALTPARLVSEALYILRPAVHLLVGWKWRKSRWKPWFASLLIECSSAYWIQGALNLNAAELSQRQHRGLKLLSYALRSPFYDQHLRQRIQALLLALKALLPSLGFLFDALLQYSEAWTKYYFYAWQ